MKTTVRIVACAAFLAAPALALAQYAPQGKSIAKLLAVSKPKSSCIVPAPGISISPPSLSFPSTAPDSDSSPQTVTMTNTGTAPLEFSGISITPPLDPDYFLVSEGCDFTLAPGQSCTVSVTFQSRGGAGTKSQVIQVFTNVAGSPHAIPAQGITGPSAPLPGYSRSPAGTIAFGNVVVGSTSAPRTITLTNTGGAPLTIDSPELDSAYFAVSASNCPYNPATLAPAASCTIDFTFTPTGPGPVGDSLSISHSAPSALDIVSLSGTGITAAAGVGFSPSDGYLGIVTTGSTYGSFVDVINTGAMPLTITAVAMAGISSGAFTIVGETCLAAGALATGASCRVNYELNPTARVYYQDQIVITSDAPSSPTVYDISADAFNPAPNFSFSSTFVDFGLVNVGATQCSTVTITNTDSMATPTPNLAINYTGSLSPPFSYGDSGTCATTCSTSLPGGSSCTIGLYFHPTDNSSYGHSLDIFDDQSQQYFYIDLQGSGFQPGPRIQLDQSVLDFGSQVVGNTSPPQALTISNIGDATLTFDNPIAVPAPFSQQSTTCTGTLAPATNCQLVVTYTPVSVTSNNEAIFISSNTAPDSGTVSVDLFGQGTAGPQASVDWFPENLDFGGVLIPTTSAPRSISFANNGAAPLTISSIMVSGEFTSSNDCPATLAANSCCTITTTYSPTFIGPTEGARITVMTDAPSGPAMIPIAGVGVPPPSITPTPSPLSFGSAVIDTFPAPQYIILKNTGIQNGLVFTTFNISGTGEFYLYDPSLSGDMAPAGTGAKQGRFKASTVRSKAPPVVPNCFSLSTFNLGEQCYIAVWWAPTFLGVHSATLMVGFMNGTGSPLMINLSGLSRPVASPDIGVSASSLTISGVINRDSPPAQLTVTNTGTAALSLYGLGVVGGPFTSTHNCPASLEPGLSCTVSVVYHATIIGTQAGTLLIQHDANAQGLLEVALTGIGLAIPLPKISVSPTSVDFGTRSVGSTTPRQAVVVRNVGTALLTVGTPMVSPGFGITNHCGDLAPGAQCTIELDFRAGGNGRTVGSLSIPSNDPASPLSSVALGGAGCRALSLSGTRTGVGGCPP